MNVVDFALWRHFLYSQIFGAGISFYISVHPVLKMWILQEPKKIEFWNELHLEEEKSDNAQHV